jgi:predicted TIM-barrel fold metal-dependent hydrolase
MFRHAPTSTGWPSHHLHDYVAHAQSFEDQLLSLTTNGIFNKFPDLKFVFIESGVTWLPSYIWRAIKTWRGVRAEVPWMKRSPAEVVRDHIRVTMQPFDSANDSETVQRLMEQIDSDRMLLFSSDYPHWQFEGDAILPPGLSADQVRRIKVDNPLETYPRLQETAP